MDRSGRRTHEHLRGLVERWLLAEPVRGKFGQVESRWEARLFRASRSLSFGCHSESDGKREAYLKGDVIFFKGWFQLFFWRGWGGRGRGVRGKKSR